MALPLTINGIDFKDWVDEYEGYTMGYTDREGTNAKTMLDGTKIVDRLARKNTLSVPMIPLSESQLKTLVTAIAKDYVPVTYFDLNLADVKTGTFIPDPISSATYVIDSASGEHWFKGIRITLMEK